ncbi:hypothetical protein JCM19233_3330 [Vibrio astriarenae]|nr:hypothetical protein JCM19233_3330 [Vibrio sp. C7]
MEKQPESTEELYKFAISSAGLDRKNINICIRNEQGTVIKTNKRWIYGY